MHAHNFVAVVGDKLMWTLNSRPFLVIGPEVENLGYRAIIPCLNPDLGTGYLLRQRSSVLRNRQADNMSPAEATAVMPINSRLDISRSLSVIIQLLWHNYYYSLMCFLFVGLSYTGHDKNISKNHQNAT